MRIFLIAGKAGSGKNVVAKLIKEYYIYKVEECAITSYSKYIKNFALELTDWDGTDANKPRDFMQHLGDVMRELDEDFLVSNMIKDITIYQKYVENLVIINNVMSLYSERIKNSFENVYAFYIVNQFGSSKLTIEQQSHITEVALEDYPDFDYIIANDDLSKLKEKVFAILDKVK